MYNEKFANTNEWRTSFGDQQRLFIARTEYEAGHKELTNRVDELKAEIDKLNNMKQGGNVVWAYLIAGIGLMLSIFALKDKVLINKK